MAISSHEIYSRTLSKVNFTDMPKECFITCFFSLDHSVVVTMKKADKYWLNYSVSEALDFIINAVLDED